MRPKVARSASFIKSGLVVNEVASFKLAQRRHEQLVKGIGQRVFLAIFLGDPEHVVVVVREEPLVKAMLRRDLRTLAEQDIEKGELRQVFPEDDQADR